MKLKINRRRALSIFNPIIFILLFAAQHALALPYTVTHTGDSGFGSLRDALTQPSANIITFNIPGAGIRTITRGVTPYPTITRSLTIDGTTQPGYAGVPLIELNANGDDYGLKFDPTLAATYSFVVRGLIINRASADGISVSGTSPFVFNTTITGCYIGTNSAGTTDLGNGEDGIAISDSNAVIGGTGFGERNVISGNNGSGIAYFGLSYNAEIYNNYIGTNAAGTSDLGNALHGIRIDSGTVVIGGTVGGVNAGNVISGNNRNGIRLFSSSPATIQRNLIGTSSNGTADLGNSQNGILIEKGNNHLIGSSSSPTDRNIISGNGGAAGEGDGIKILPSSSSTVVSGTQIFGNRIGTNSAGTAVLQNDGDGIEINDSAGNQIGLAGSNTARNTISGNNFNGIIINGALSTGNIIQYNSIGTDQILNNLGNGGDGIRITSAGLNTIGGATANAGNTIGFNGPGYGVSFIGNTTGNTLQFNTIFSNIYSGVVVTTLSNGNLVRQNAIYGNQQLGIDLGNNGITPNDLNDADTGANTLQNFPVLQGANPNRIVGTLNSIANQNYTIDFYRVDSCDAGGNGEGRYYLASTNVTTASNNAAFNFAYSGLTAGQIITATATDSNGNTSEFSQCRTVTPVTGDLQLSSATYSTNENGGSATITVNRIGGTTGTITVDYATSNGTATAGADYTATSGTLIFLNGETTKTFSVPVIDDTMDEPTENFNVGLSVPMGGAILLTPSQAIVSITDNDNPPTISITDVTLNEGNSGTTDFTFTVNLSAASGFNISVNYQTANGTATGGIDYTAASGTINFSSVLGETSKTVTVAVNGDLTVELNETFFVNLSNPTNATVADAQGIGTITDDDNPGSLQFEQSVYSGAEGAAVLVIVTRTNGTAGTVAVNYATGGGDAIPNVDYTPASGTLIFGDREISKMFSVAILPDSENELLETFNIILSNPIGGATVGSPSTATVNIASPTAAIVSVGGRVSIADGRGVSNAFVSLTDPNGATRTATTNPFGYYRFNNVQAGATYIFTVRHKRHQFTMRVLTVGEDLSELNFTADK